MNFTPLAIRDPKGGSAGKGFKGGSYSGGGSSSGGGGGNLPLWAKLVIVFSVIWVCVYISLFIFFLRRDYTLPRRSPPAAPNRPRPSLPRALARAAWKALLWATLVQLLVVSVRKVRECSCWRVRRERKRVGGTFYRKLDEEKGEGVGPEATRPPRVSPAPAYGFGVEGLGAGRRGT